MRIYDDMSPDTEGGWTRVSSRRSKGHGQVGVMSPGGTTNGRASAWPGPPLVDLAPLSSTLSNPPVPPYGGAPLSHRTPPRTYAQAVTNTCPRGTVPEGEDHYLNPHTPRVPRPRSVSTTSRRPTVRWRQEFTNRNYKSQYQEVWGHTGHNNTRQDIHHSPRPFQYQNKTPRWRRPVETQGDTPPQRNTNYLQPSIELARQIRTIHKLLKLRHHQNNVSTEGTYPPTITRTIKYLTDLVKPAYPTPDIREAAEVLATQWATFIMDLMQDHYREQIQILDKTLHIDLGSQEWEQAFDIAVKWTQKNLKRLTRSTIAQTKQHIKDTLRINTPVFPDGPENPQTPSQGTPSSPRTYTSTTTQVEEGDTDAEEPSPQRRDTPLPPLQPNSLQRPLEIPRGLQTMERGPTRIPTPLPQRGPPQEQQLHTSLRDTHLVPPEDKDTSSFFENLWVDESYSDFSKGAQQEALQNTETHIGSPTVNYKQIVTIHPHGETTQWDLKPHSKFIVLTDKMLSQKPTSKHCNIQIEYYPEANYQNIHDILLPLGDTPFEEVTDLVMAIGLNTGFPTLSGESDLVFHGSITMAIWAFPKARIWIPQIYAPPDKQGPHKQSFVLGHRPDSRSKPRTQV